MSFGWQNGKAIAIAVFHSGSDFDVFLQRAKHDDWLVGLQVTVNDVICFPLTSTWAAFVSYAIQLQTHPWCMFHSTSWSWMDVWMQNVPSETTVTSLLLSMHLDHLISWILANYSCVHDVSGKLNIGWTWMHALQWQNVKTIQFRSWCLHCGMWIRFALLLSVAFGSHRLLFNSDVTE